MAFLAIDKEDEKKLRDIRDSFNGVKTSIIQDVYNIFKDVDLTYFIL
jgi:hypothetical protein